MALRGRDPRGTGVPPRQSRRSLRRALAALVVLIPSCLRFADAADLPGREGFRGVPPLRTLDLPVRASVARAIEHASRKLEKPRCRDVFSDYRDLQGRTLLQNLEASGLDAPAHLRTLTFANGRYHSDCRLPSVLALASPGSQLIYICGPQFLQRQMLDPGFMAALLIHEQLHALGLGENPPHSQEITARVINHCGR